MFSSGDFFTEVYRLHRLYRDIEAKDQLECLRQGLPRHDPETREILEATDVVAAKMYSGLPEESGHPAKWATFLATLKRQSLQSRYRLTKTVGYGTYGKVMLAIDRATNQRVAIKQMSLATRKNHQNFQMNEVKILSTFGHAHVIKCNDVFIDESKVFIVTEFCEGGDLYSLFKKQRTLPEATARTIMRQLVDAVKALHSRGICHRDLKLENILLRTEQDLDVAVIDFGLSIESANALKTRVGTPHYVAPEVILAERDGFYSHQCDMWSVGVISYYLLFG